MAHESLVGARARATLGVLLASAALMSVATPASAGSASWPMFGQNAQNTANQSGETAISTANANQLALKWSFTTSGDVSARAAVIGGAVYFPDWGGYLYALNASTGLPIWARQLSDYTQVANTH